MSATNNNLLIENLGAVVLCGGKSKRLGVDKSHLIFDGQTFLERVVSCTEQVCKPIVLVGNTDLARHDLSADIGCVADEQIGKGPLEGIRVGLKWLADQQVEFAFVTSCDVPLLRSDLIRLLFVQLGDQQAAIPVETNRVFGMAAVYRTELHLAIGQRIVNDQLRVSDLANVFAVNQIDVEELRAVDPELDSLTNVNTAEDYRNLLKRFGLKCPQQFDNQLGGSDG